MMQLIPLTPVPSQSLTVNLAGQPCKIAIYTEETGLYIDLAINQKVIMTGVLCRDRVRLVRYSYLGFVGDLVFEDTTGSDDPIAEGLGNRFQLVYLEAGDL